MDDFALSCPVPLPGDETIKVAHGGGGRATERLLDTIFRPAFDGPELARRHDGARLDLAGPLAFTTDSYVVRPLVFPGGDIGSLAVNGTVNDLAMCGARPAFLSAAFILEEGLETALLGRIVASMRDAARAAGVRIVTGDLKVVDRGKADGVFITTAGVGSIVAPTAIEPQSVRPGDVVILSGDVGRHGIAVMAAREGLGFEPAIASDCASAGRAGPGAARRRRRCALPARPDPRRARRRPGRDRRDERARDRDRRTRRSRSASPSPPPARSSGSIRSTSPTKAGSSPSSRPDDADRAIAILRAHAVSEGAVAIGAVTPGPAGRVSCRGLIGGTRVLDMLSGEQLPRIC